MTEPPCSVGVVTYILHESVMGPFLFSASVALNITIHQIKKKNPKVPKNFGVFLTFSAITSRTRDNVPYLINPIISLLV